MTHAPATAFSTTVQADLDGIGWGTTPAQPGLVVRPSPSGLPGRAEIVLPEIAGVFNFSPVAVIRRREPVTGIFAIAQGDDDEGYHLSEFRTGMVPSLRATVRDQVRDKKDRRLNRDAVPELFDRFGAVLAKDLTTRGIPVTQGRLYTLLALRYARGLGELVNAQHAGLPHRAYDYIAADAPVNVLLINFSKRFNPYRVGDERKIQPPIPLTDAQKLASVPARMLAELYLPHLGELDFSD